METNKCYKFNQQEQIMNNPNTAIVTQKDFDTLPLFLSKQSDNEIDFNDNDTVSGIVYVCIGGEDDWIGLDFKANINKSYMKGELWRDSWGTHTISAPSVEIDDIGNITVSYNDSSDIEISDIDYTTRIDDISKLVSDFICAQELTVESKHNVYTTYNV